MRKTTIIIAITITSLIIMACSISGYTQQKMTAQPTLVEGSTVIKTQAEPTTVEEIQSAVEPSPTDTIQPTTVSDFTPTPTTDPLRSARSCLANNWEIIGLSDYVVAAIPSELAEEYNLEYIGTTGKAFLALTPKGEVVLNADELIIKFNAQYSIFEVPVIVSIDGNATGLYDINTDTLTTSNMQKDGLVASAKVLNEDVIDPAEIVDAIPLIHPPFNTAKYACMGDTLELELDGYPDDIPPLKFHSVK